MARGHYACSCCDGTGERPDCDGTGEIPGLMTMKLPPNHPKLGALEKLQEGDPGSRTTQGIAPELCQQIRK